MDSDTWIQIIFLFLLILGASYCAASEISFASMNRIRVENYANHGDARAKKAIFITNNFDQALTTLLIGNNITHIGFASLATVISTRLWGVQSVKYTTFVATIVVFLVSELIPKSYAKDNSEKYALAVSGSLVALMKIMTPVTRFFTGITNRMMGFLPEGENTNMTNEEFIDIIEIVQNEEALDEDQKKLVHSAVHFDNITVGDILTPLKDVEAMALCATKEEIMENIRSQKFSRIPIYRQDINQIVGVLQATSFIKQFLTDPDFEVQEILSDPYFVKKDVLVDNLLKEMSTRKFHLAIVVDDFSKTIGVITLEDILEELVGEIWDETDSEEDYDKQ